MVFCRLASSFLPNIDALASGAAASGFGVRLEVGHTCTDGWAVHLGWLLCWIED